MYLLLGLILDQICMAEKSKTKHLVITELNFHGWSFRSLPFPSPGGTPLQLPAPDTELEVLDIFIKVQKSCTVLRLLYYSINCLPATWAEESFCLQLSCEKLLLLDHRFHSAKTWAFIWCLTVNISSFSFVQIFILGSKAELPVGSVILPILPSGSLIVGSHYVSLKYVFNYMVGWFFVFLLRPPYSFCPREAKTSIQAFDCLLHLIRHVLVSDQCVPETKDLHSSPRFSPFRRQNVCKFHVSDHLLAKTTSLLRGSVPMICCSWRDNSPRISDKVHHLNICKWSSLTSLTLPEYRFWESKAQDLLSSL